MKMESTCAKLFSWHQKPMLDKSSCDGCEEASYVHRLKTSLLPLLSFCGGQSAHMEMES